jgi:hypothetical protein
MANVTVAKRRARRSGMIAFGVPLAMPSSVSQL